MSYYTVACTFPYTKTRYVYKVPENLNLKAGDRVIVPNGQATVAAVYKKPRDTKDFDYKFVKGKVPNVK